MFSRVVICISAISLSSAFIPVSAQNTQESDQPKAQRSYLEGEQLVEQFWQSHQTPGADTYSLRVTALDQVRAMRALPHSQTAQTPSWTPLGPNLVNFFGQLSSGATAGMAVDNTNPSTVYMGSAGGGVWKTTNSGASWSPLTDQEPFLEAASFVMDPNNSQVLYLGAPNGAVGGSILKSSDGGATWTDITGPFTGPFGPSTTFGGSARIFDIAVQPGNSNVLLVGAYLPNGNPGVYRSADGGATWAQETSTGQSASTVLFDPVTPTNAYAALCNGYGTTGGIYKSTDAGITWSILAGGLPSPTAVGGSYCTLNISPSNPSTLVAEFSLAAGPLVFLTSNAGATWTQVTSPPDNPHNSNAAIFFSPINSNIIFVGSAELYRSLDAGQTWVGIAAAHGVHVDVGGYAFVGKSNEMYLGNDGGAYHTADVSATNIQWTDLNGTMATLRVYPGMSMHPTDPTILLGGTQDEGTIRSSGTLNWVSVGACGDGGPTAIDQVNPLQVYADCYPAHVERSTDGGMTFSTATTGINLSDPAQVFPPLVADPSNGSNVYYGTNHVYQSTNAAVLWTAISPAFNSLISIAVSPTSSNTVWAAEANAVWVSNNALSGTGAVWTKTTSGLPPRTITQVTADPGSSTTAYVTVSGFTGFGDSLGHVFKTTNGGSTWTDISGNLPNIPAEAIAADPDIRNSLYLATDVGAFASTDGGQTWLPYGTGLPNAIETGIELFHPTRLIRVSTFGRGFFSISAPPASITASTASLSFPSQPVNTSSSGQPFTLTNNLTSSIAINSITASGNFSETNSCPATLTPSASCTVNVIFSPLTIAALTGSVVVNSDHGSATIALSGTGTGLPVVSLSAPTLSFTNQPVGFASTAQSVTVTNNGTATLTNIGLSVTGANASVFSQTSTCTSSLSIGSSCTISLTFTPSSLGSSSATLSIADNAANSPQTAVLSGASVGAFALSTTTPSDSVTAGSSAPYTLSLATPAGYSLSAAVQLSCSGLPALSTCIFAPSSVPVGSSTQTITLSIETTAATADLVRPQMPVDLLRKTAAALCGLFGVGLLWRRRRLGINTALLLTVCLALCLSGCGGSKSTGSSGTLGTPAGSYSITVTAQSASYQTNQSLTLNVH